MTLMFWLDVAAYGLSATLAAAVIVHAAGWQKREARYLALFVLFIALWAISSIGLRLALWVQSLAPGALAGVPELWMEVTTLCLALAGPSLLVFTARYVNRSIKWPTVAAVVGLLGMLALSYPLFQHRLVFDPYLTASGVLNYEVSTLGFGAAGLPAVYFAWSLLLFWLERRRTGEPYLAVSVLIMLLGFLGGGLFNPPFPVMSFTTTICVLVLGYGVISRQLFNPLREMNIKLEERVEERTRELAETATRLETANVTLAQRSKQLAAAAQVARAAAMVRDPKRLLEDLASLIAENFGFYHVGIFLIDEAGQYAVLRAISSAGGQQRVRQHFKVGLDESSVIGYVARSGVSRITFGVSDSFAVTSAANNAANTLSEIALPLKVRDRILGVLDIMSRGLATFADEDVGILQTVADQVALSIENARLLEETQDRLREVDALMGTYGKEGWLRIIGDRPDWGYVYDGVEVLAADETTVERRETDLQVPLRVRGGSIGELELSLPRRAPSGEETAVIESVAEQLGLALENARLFLETQGTLREMEALYAASRRLTTATTLPEVADAIIACVQETEVDGCVVVQFEYSASGEPEALSYLGSWRRDREPSFRPGLRLPISRSPFPFDMVSTFWTVPDIERDRILPESARQVYKTTGVGALANIPLHSRDRVIGQVVVLRGEAGPFSTGAIRLYEMLSDQAAVALERSQLLEQTQRRAQYQQYMTEMTARIRASTEIETILRTAIRELGRTLRASDGMVRLGGSQMLSVQVGRGEDDNGDANV